MASTDGGFDWSGLFDKGAQLAVDVARVKLVDAEQHDGQMYGFEDQYYGYNGSGGGYGVNGNQYAYRPNTPGSPISMPMVLGLGVLAVVAVFVVKRAL